MEGLGTAMQQLLRSAFKPPVQASAAKPVLPRHCLCVLPAGMTVREATQYWYTRAHRALKQRWSDPNQMMREYQHVAALDDGIEHTTSAAKSKAASGRNRYCNVLPYDYNR